MRFTIKQYDQAIADLQDAKRQLEPDGHSCSVCGDSGHMAFECGHNPLVAMMMCQQSSELAQNVHIRLHAHETGGTRKTCNECDGHGFTPDEEDPNLSYECDTCDCSGMVDPVPEEIHHALHWLAGECQAFGVQLGPHRVVLPEA